MKQHPIPQDITNYKFHLIGSMTLKQFAEVAVGVVLAFLVYKTNLIGIVKWPLILLCAGLGAAVAFVPIEERPLDHWIKTFFKNIYKPTKFFWKKANKVADFFSYQITSNQDDFFAPDVNFAPARQQRVFEYLKSIPADEKIDDFDLAENQKINKILNEFNSVHVDQSEVQIQTKKQEKPNLQTRVRKLKAPQEQTLVANRDHLPNQIFGLVINESGQAVTQALIEIQNQSGESLRIIKSDQSGNFIVNTPLENGHYLVLAEKDTYKYPPLQIELRGEVLNPLVIKP
ncbi:MAG TPA: PrgI family protein [Candidatus Woesebacteria bacterium]|nr:PrgI family protein [Candidatus Woesebacteria bacterium]